MDERGGRDAILKRETVRIFDGESKGVRRQEERES